MCKVCLGTACHVRGSSRILELLEQEIGVKPGETSQDGKFSVEEVRCFGSCALAPVMVIDDQVFGNVTTSKAEEILKEY
jgi:NADH-quinone oxidoreductase subunit E